MSTPTDMHHADYRGDLTGKHLRDGPLHERKCTDLLCLLLFLTFWGGMSVVGYYSVKVGTPLELTYAYDQKGVPCGQGNRTNYPMLLFIVNNTNDTKYSINNTICATSCPNGQGAEVSCYSGADFNANNNMCNNQAQQKTYPVLNRFCFSSDNSVQAYFASKGFSLDSLSSTTSDMLATWPMIFAVGGFALVIGFVYMMLMKFCSGVLIWGILTIFVLGSAGFGVVAFTTTPNSDSTFFLAKLSASSLKAIAYSCWGFAGLFALLIICLHERICLSIAILKAAAHFLQDEPGIFILPPLFFVLTLGFYAGWILIAGFIVGMNDIKPASGGLPYATLDWNTTAGGLLTYHFFGLFWNHAFGIALSQFIIASSVCLWYFKQGSKRCSVSPIRSSLARSITHMGSLAFGSFLIGLLDFIRYLLKFVETKVKAASASSLGGDAVKAGFCLACCTCVVGCFERSMKFLTNHAYIQIAMTGESFCKATSEAFFLALRNAARFGLVHGFSVLFLKLGQIIISGSATLLGYIIITHANYYQVRVVSPVIPTILFFISSYLVAHSFMSIYGMSADTIVHCFAMDEEIHDGQVMHAPEEIKDYLDHHMSKKLLVEQ